MTSLQLTLIALGILLILLVLGFNWFQEKRVQKHMQRQFQSPEHDPLLGQADRNTPNHLGSQEPYVGSETEEISSEQPVKELVLDPIPNRPLIDKPIIDKIPDDDRQLSFEVEEEPVDDFCEAVIDVQFAHPVSGQHILQVTQTYPYAGSKPLRYFAETTHGHMRSSLRPTELYKSVQVALTIVNSEGPLNEIDWSQAYAVADKLATDFEGSIEHAKLGNLMKRAKELDEICMQLAAIVGITLEFEMPHEVTEVARIAQRQGFVMTSSGLAWCNAGGQPRFYLHFSEVDADQNISSAKLELNVPRSPADNQAFARMLAVARELAQALNARLVDDAGRPVMSGSEHIIDEELNKLYAELERQGFPAGSPRALRIFS